MKFFSLLCFFCIILYGTSCTLTGKVPKNYLQNATDTSGKDWKLLGSTVIQKNDLLSIRVYSKAIGTQPTADAPYNLPDQSGFLVDLNGNIEYPQLGILHVEGLTKEQLADTIKRQLQTQLTQPTVIVRFLNYRITILGEVRSPSSFSVPVDRINIFEALGLAGDITEFGSKTNVRIVRENNGQREIAVVDLTSKDIFSSPYYQLQQNDMLFVEQNRRKINQQTQQTMIQQIGIATTIITTVALILGFIFRR
jgi:polysaccharide export outer membrane protein